ncbi:Hypothetical predicted protein, partial [Podarcis lilfordi]
CLIMDIQSHLTESVAPFVFQAMKGFISNSYRTLEEVSLDCILSLRFKVFPAWCI